MFQVAYRGVGLDCFFCSFIEFGTDTIARYKTHERQRQLLFSSDRKFFRIFGEGGASEAPPLEGDEPKSGHSRVLQKASFREECRQGDKRGVRVFFVCGGA